MPQEAQPDPGRDRIRSRSFYFDGPDGSLFGWVHEPGSAAMGTGVVICNPYGFEEISAHRCLRQLALEFAGLGLPALRFDLPGCGDSAGDENEPDLLLLWRSAVGCAIDALKQSAGVAQVIVVGFGLGATLGYQGSGLRRDVCGLVAVAPVVKGRRYVRELKMLGRASRPPGMNGMASDVVEAAGFAMTTTTAAAIAAIDLTATTPDAAPPRMLIIERDGEPTGEGAWAERLAATDVEVVVERCCGYAQMVTDPQSAVVPRQMFDRIEEVVAEWSAGVQRSAEPGIDPITGNDSETQECRFATTCQVDHAVHESTFVVDGASVFGILAKPTGGEPSSRAIVLLNSGAVHHVGPNRLWVELARRWARHGFTVLRLDLSGIGDADCLEGAQDNDSYPPHAVDDIQRALDGLREQCGVSEYHLVGLCSGAYHAFRAGVAALPIASATMVNPLTFSWEDDGPRKLKTYEIIELAEDYRTKVLSASTWRRLYRRDLDLVTIARVLARRLSYTLDGRLRRFFGAVGMGRTTDLAALLRRAADRGLSFAFVFAEGDAGYRLLQDECGSDLSRLLDSGSVTIDVVCNADHTFTQLEARQRLVGVLDSLPPFAGHRELEGGGPEQPGS